MYLLLHPPEAPDPATAAQAGDPNAEHLLAIVAGILDGSRGNASEAKSWLLSSLAQLQPTEAAAAERFEALLPLPDVQESLLQLFVESCPEQSTALLLERKDWMQAFFSEPAHVSAWFDHFSARTDLAGLQHGSQALARFALRQRGEAWEHLVWRGGQGHSPVVVAAKPFLFAQLDVPATVARLWAGCPAFWRSRELQEALAPGSFLALSPRFFVSELQRWLAEGGEAAERLWEQLKGALRRLPFSRLCLALLPRVPEPQLLAFATGILPPLSHNSGMPETAAEAGQRIVFGSLACDSLAQLRLFCALALRPRQLRALLAEDRAGRKAVQRAAGELCEGLSAATWHVLAAAGAGPGLWRTLLAQQWAVFAHFSELGLTREADVALRAAGLQPEWQADEGSEADQEAEHRAAKRRKKRHKKKKKRKRGSSGSDSGDSDGGWRRPQRVSVLLRGGRAEVAASELPALLSGESLLACVRWSLQARSQAAGSPR